MLWTSFRGRLVGAAREPGGMCLVEQALGSTEPGTGEHTAAADGDATRVLRLSDEDLAGEPVCLATVVDASLAGECALLLLRSQAPGVVRFVLLELFDSSHCLQPRSVLTFTLSEQEHGAEKGPFPQDHDADGAHPGLPFAATRPWILDGPVVCIPCERSLVVAHLAMGSRRGEVSPHPPRRVAARSTLWRTVARAPLSLCTRKMLLTSRDLRFHSVGACTKLKRPKTSSPAPCLPSAPSASTMTSLRLS